MVALGSPPKPGGGGATGGVRVIGGIIAAPPRPETMEGDGAGALIGRRLPPQREQLIGRLRYILYP